MTSVLGISGQIPKWSQRVLVGVVEAVMNRPEEVVPIE